MLNKVKAYIDKNNLLDMRKEHIVALSGGADSVCLLLMMKELGYKIHAAHCNFHLRGDESYRDEQFCKELCENNKIPFHFTHFETKEYSEAHKISIEMAARELRYSYFEQLRLSLNAANIVVAHHMNDNVETLLMNLIRGTGIHGLEAIKPKNGRIIRPLLCLTRMEIEQYLAIKKQNYVTDSTNLIPDVVRNIIRLRVIPILKSINPAVQENIARTISNISEIVKIVDDSTSKSIKACYTCHNTYNAIHIIELQKQASPEYVLFSILAPLNFTSAQITQIYQNINAQPGRVWKSSTHTVVTDRKTLLIIENNYLNNSISFSIPECGIYAFKKARKIELSISSKTDSFTPSKNRECVTIDSAKVSFPLLLRNIKRGDRFIPYGMNGSKLVSDYLTDKKRNYIQRCQQLVIEDASGDIIWVVGERISQKVACTSQTINVLMMRYFIDEK